jgi:hypothetical protein
MEKRFGPDNNKDGMVDYHWIPDGTGPTGYVHGHYDPAYIYPTQWKIIFNGCQTYNDYSRSRQLPTTGEDEYYYVWTMDGTALTNHNCKFTQSFTDKLPHTVVLSVLKYVDDSSQTFPAQTVQVKDYLIISIGDSYASGQGNPDIEQVVDPAFPIGWDVITPARWQDTRCMRSANAGPALAALALEAQDPHSSVTFLSFACTGDTIYTDNYDPVQAADGSYFWGNRGSGILGPSRGEITDVPWGDWSRDNKPQILQIQEALDASNGQPARQIDALLISAGGNDMKFAPMIMMCILFPNCWVNDLAQLKINPITDTQAYDLYDVVTRTVGKWTGDNPPEKTIPAGYAALGAAIHDLYPKPAHVYVTQYPEPTINDRGVANEASETYEHHCRMLDDVLWPNPYNVLTDQEAITASHHAQTELNTAVRNAVTNLATTYTDIDWQFVDGLSVFDVDPNLAVAGKPGLFKGGPDGGPGHGYCASDNWIRRADESELMQGPVNDRKSSLGTMHPNYAGQQAIKTRILRYMVPDLTGQADQTPDFTFSYSSGELTSQAGLNGWYTHSCHTSSGACNYPKVVGRAVATSSSIPLLSAHITVNDVPGCTTAGTIPGVSCNITMSSTKRQVGYDVEITATGVYRFQFLVQAESGQVYFLQKEIKVDLEDPVLATPVGPFQVDAGSSVGLSAHIATVVTGNPPQEVPMNGDVVVNFDWDLNNDGTFETEDEQPTFSAAGIAGPASVPIQVKVTDRAGRTAIAPSEIQVLYIGPTVTINGAPATSLEGTAIHLTSTASGSGDPETFGYAWEVKKNGNSYKTGLQTEFSFTPNDNGSYEVSLSVTDNTDLEGKAANQTIDVTNVAPTVAINGAPASVSEGTAIHLTSTVSDPGTMDTFTYEWEVKKDGASYLTGQAPDIQFTPEVEGSYEVTFRAIDDDLGVGTASGTIEVTDIPLTVTIDGAPVTSPEGTAIHLTSTVSGLGTADTITYAWEVKKNGTSYLSGAEAGFSFTPDDNGSYEVSLQVTADGEIATAASQAIVVTNIAPTAAISGATTPSPEGETIHLTGQDNDPGTADTFTYAWEVKKDGTSYLTGVEAGIDFTPEDNGSFEISLQVTDDDGGVGMASVTIDVTNVAPLLDGVQYSPENVDEGGSVTVSGGIGDPGIKDTLTLSIDWGDGSPLETKALAAGTISFTASHTYADDNPTGTASDKNTITLEIKDKDGASNGVTGEVTVANLAPALVLSAPQSGTLYTVNATANLSASLTDPSSSDTLTCSIDWGDGVTAAGTMSAGGCMASHAYPATGVYTIQVTGTDDDLGSKTETVMVVVYDPSAGFVTGGGWINSPAGAYKPDTSLSGKATYGFVSKYVKGAAVPTGNTAFKFEAGGIQFASSAYEWLVVNQAGKNAQFKGKGLINGAPDLNGNPYKFMLWAGDGTGAGGADAFRIRIWWEDAAGEHDVYDNGTDQAIDGGNIVVHTK